MRLSRRGLLVLPGGMALGCSAHPGPPAPLRVATGPAGGPYAQFGSRLATELGHGGLAVRVLTTGGSVANLAMLADGRADLGFTMADSADDAVNAANGPAIAAIARLYMNYLHLVVPTGSPVTTPGQLAGHTISVGANGSGTAVTALRLLAAVGLHPPARTLRLDLEESIEALLAGRVQAFFWSGGVSTPALAAFARRVPVRLIPLGSLAPALRRAHGPVYESTLVPAGQYGSRRPVPTVGTPSYLLCPAALPYDAAHRITAMLFENRDRLEAPDAPGSRLDLRYAIHTGAVPLHPGAARYYRSVYG
ncbi:hypothetical protein SAMN05421505_107154 [Sinosporangium album]|uniref:TRAP transporter solute receptor, TAXI family n=1 Tax=Sinosporangium album TaxID=504805 RepID=A0A1G7WR34_9ACTN|nr:TAXI family TRAP transporter solute-binding subunit [Sinosporangium album]SDG74344.1 hypothetical protein SAMN05421505_107154 [Sinosporangium album]